MGKLLLISNNPDLKDQITGIDFHMVETLDIMKVLEIVRDHVHLGYKLITHPLSGSVKPYETPYKSVMVEKHGTVDTLSLGIIEDAISMANKFKRERHFNDKLLADFRLIDADLILRGL